MEILASKDDVFAYMSGDNKYSLFLKEDIDKFWLVDEKIKELITEESAGLIIELGKNEKKFKKANEEKYNELSGIVTKITKEIVPIMFDKTQLAVQHKTLKDILDYAIQSDELKNYHKSKNISDKKDSITSGETTAKEVAMEKRDAESEAKEQKAAEEGPSGGQGQDTESESEESEESESEESEESDTEPEGGSDNDYDSVMSGGDNIKGGKLFKSAEEKEYNKFKGEERKAFTEKKDKFMKDEVKIIAFLDANITTLMTSYEKNKLGANVNKSSMKTNTDLIEALFTAVTTYEKELETSGAAVEMIAKSAEAPAAGEGDAAAEKGDAAKGEGDAAKGEGDAAKGEGDAAAAKGDAAAEKGDAAKGEKAPEAAPAPAKGGSQCGGGHTTTKTKKKHQKKKKLPKNINININLGKTNILYEDTSDSSSSSSDSSSSSSDSSSSSSDSDDESEEEEKVVKKNKKQVKYVVNATKKKNKTKRRPQNNDEE